MFLNKIQMLVVELISFIGSVIKYNEMTSELGIEKFILIISVIIISMIITLSESESKDC